MTLRLAWRSLASQPVRSAVLAGGFGLGIAAMAGLLGVGAVIVEQAAAPALSGGGEVVLLGGAGRIDSARFVLSHILGAPPLAEAIAVASPSTTATLYLIDGEGATPVRARGGVPTLERRLGDPETSTVEAWTDAPGDRRWTAPDAADILRSMDRFHAIPPRGAGDDSWAEWLYFNGGDDEVRFYLTFLVGSASGPGVRTAGVRLQLDRGGSTSNYFARAEVDEAELLAGAPNLSIAGNQVRLEGMVYRIRLALAAEARAAKGEVGVGGAPADLTGELTLRAVAGGALPPLEVRGADGWISGYVAPVLSGELDGFLAVDGKQLSLSGASGYHDHNWGFWKDVTWQWGQAAGDDVSFVYGRIFPPDTVADPGRVPGFLIALGPDGPLGYALRVTIDEIEAPATGEVARIDVHAVGRDLEITLQTSVESMVRTRMDDGPLGRGLEFFQMRGPSRVRGRVAGRELDLTVPQATAETFRGLPDRAAGGDGR